MGLQVRVAVPVESVHIPGAAVAFPIQGQPIGPVPEPVECGRPEQFVRVAPDYPILSQSIQKSCLFIVKSEQYHAGVAVVVQRLTRLGVDSAEDFREREYG